MQEYKICPNCNYNNFDGSFYCQNCGVQLQFNYGAKQNSLNVNVDNRKVKNASQMMWVFVGNLIFYEIIGTLVSGFLKSFIDSFLIILILNTLIYVGILHLTSKRIFLKNALYKNQKEVFVEKIKKFFIIVFIFLLIFNLYLQRSNIAYMLENGFFDFIGDAYSILLLLAILSLVINYLILPRIVAIPLIKEFGTESVNEEVKS